MIEVFLTHELDLQKLTPKHIKNNLFEINVCLYHTNVLRLRCI